ncbi:MAG: L,D-transpeptidase [Gemmobacter sp.]|jgi:L,D-transpeptidase ErfK/SrfK
MSADSSFKPSRRAVLGGAAAMLGTAVAGPVLAQTESSIVANISSFRMLDWQPYFPTLENGAILVDTVSRALHYWSPDQMTYKLYPTSVPVSPELTRLGRTTIIKKDPAPSWRPTPSMRERNPDWPEYIPPGPDCPLGTRAMWLSWEYYRIHGTHDTRKIGRKSSNGCIGMFNEHVEELYDYVQIGAQVLLI